MSASMRMRNGAPSSASTIKAAVVLTVCRSMSDNCRRFQVAAPRVVNRGSGEATVGGAGVRAAFITIDRKV